jgi:hypothetical protein
MNTKTTEPMKKHLKLPKDCLRTIILFPTSTYITDIKQTFLFKFFSHLLIASQKGLQNYMNSMNYTNQLNYYFDQNNNILRNPIWLTHRVLKHPFAYTISLISIFLITLNSPSDANTNQFNIKNFLKNPIHSATIDVFIHSEKQIYQSEIDKIKINKNKIKSARPGVSRISLLLHKSFTQINRKE